MADLLRWQTLICACGSARFVEVVELKRHPQGGLSRDGAGYRCAACHQDADTAQMLRAIQLQRQRDQLAALEQELAGDDAAPPVLPAVPPLRGSSRA